MVNKATSRPRVVIVGGGFSGSYCARKLQKKFEVTLIDTKDYFEFTPSVLRVLVEPSHIRKIQSYHAEYLDEAHFIRDCVKTVNSDHVVLMSKKKVPFDYLIVTAGSSYNAPIKHDGLKRATRAKELAGYHADLKKAKRVLVIGGGVVGVELAAEICTYYPEKKVILAHSRDELLNRNLPKVRKYAQRFLEDHGVDIKWNSHVQGGKGKIYKTKEGDKITADMAFLCIGIKPNFELMKKTFAKKLDERGFIKVEPTQQVKGLKNIFAAGDVTAIKEEKTAQNAEAQAKIVVDNICRLTKGKGLVTYASKKRVMDISLGKYDGIIQFERRALTGSIPAFLKWFVERKTMIHYG